MNEIITPASGKETRSISLVSSDLFYHLETFSLSFGIYRVSDELKKI